MTDGAEFNGVWIPADAWLDKRLSATEKMVLAGIGSMCVNGECGASNDDIARFCQCSTSKVSKAIAKLANLGYMRIVSFDGRTRTIEMAVQQSHLRCKEAGAACSTR